MKENAKEYLKEFAKTQEDWLKALIYDVIETNGDISNEKRKEIFQNLLNNTELTINEPSITEEDSDLEIYISKLNHIKGVGALAENQQIKFVKDVTILNGLNGAGKSSYFKILNEIVGGNQKKDILPNIYSESKEPLEVELVFNEKGKEPQTISWDGSTRSVEILNKCKVFDTSYLKGLLEIRKADTTLIEPLSLNLFTYLVGLIDEFKKDLLSEADKKRLVKPKLEYCNLEDEINKYFENHQNNKSLKRKIEGLYVFSEVKAKELEQTNKNIDDLKQINIQDKIKLKKNDKNELEKIKNDIKDIHKNIVDFLKKSEESLKEFIRNKEMSMLAKEQFSILSSIPANDTEEWKGFIKAGEQYISKSQSSEDVCPYCYQPLADDDAINLVKAYGSFLKDESEQKLSKSIKDIDNQIREIERLKTKIEIKEDIKTTLNEHKFEDTSQDLYQEIININDDFTLIKTQLLEKLNNKNNDISISILEIANIIPKLELIIGNIQKEIIELSEENTKKVEKIKILEISLNNLLQNESINKQAEKIKEWFSIATFENKLREKASKINTNKITTLSKTAHNDLLTESLKQNFLTELNNLGYKNLDITVENSKGGKGVSSTKLILSKNDNIKEVLSEGEQKAVALALFIAESKIQKNSNPIILDDPVNSLDHKIAANFAESLLTLNNQIILFNHNRLFLDAFETAKEHHICKTIDSACSNTKGKHIRVYQVTGEGKNLKGVLSNYKTNRAKCHIKDAKQLLKKSPFDEMMKTAALIRKTIECTIDEVIFNNQVPTKYSNKLSRIAWDELKNFNNDGTIIDYLKGIHSRVSGGLLHNGTENEQNPIDVDEFNEMIIEIEKILK